MIKEKLFRQETSWAVTIKSVIKGVLNNFTHFGSARLFLLILHIILKNYKSMIFGKMINFDLRST